MSDEEARREVVRHWLKQAQDSLASAQAENAAGRFNFAVNRAYYACFYVASAVLLSDGRKFVKHSGVRAAIHRHLVKTGRIGSDWGQFYDLLFRRRGQADYQELVMFDDSQSTAMVQKARDFVGVMERVLGEY